MSKKLIAGTVTGILLAATAAVPGTAAAECQVVDNTLTERYRGDVEFRRELSGQLLRDARNLRAAAATLASYGKDDACQVVADAVSELLKNPQEAQQLYMEEGTAKRVETGAGQAQQQPEGDWDARHQARLAQAQPLGEAGQLRADQLIGTEVQDVRGEDVGEVDDLLVGREGRNYLIVSKGGFLGIAEEHLAIPMEQVRISVDRNTMFLAMTEEQIDRAPSFRSGDRDRLADEAWVRENDAYYSGIEPSWPQTGNASTPGSRQEQQADRPDRGSPGEPGGQRN